MGFVRGNVLPILKEHAVRPFSGHCLCLGQADVYFTYENLRRMAQIAQVRLPAETPIKLSHRPEFAMKEYISRETLFENIGFSQVSALDYSDFENAEYVFDLNSSDMPGSLKEKFDVVVNHGTMEHVFHIPNCLANMHQLLKVGGRVIHSSPSSNFLDHGFYMFSPTLFYDYYTANRWTIRLLQVISTHPSRQEVDAPFYADYEPGIFDHLSSGGLDSNAYGTICIAEKTAESTYTEIPQQGFYKRLGDWDNQTVPPGPMQEFRLSPPFEHVGGNCWVKSLKEYGIHAGDDTKRPRVSAVKLMENDHPLGPAHTMHETIRQYGKGCYSHWVDVLYFSASDNSDPNTNGYVYRIKAPKGSHLDG